ncbi:methyl-accepting chemotaxis protein [Sphingomonas lenta]|uniref:ATPase n=1 Tax=Sphingomonas lenta TaxID=1141887 RepID=A0A2A2SJD2_9SPHN|nr:methyl-accepting chemotaxis protein [Sphingomonas lenta]PAX09328.1 hypothetical protein CKY28_00785 [Sphingomonas lenta]
MEYRAEEGFVAAGGWDQPEGAIEHFEPEEKNWLRPAVAGGAVALWFALALWLAGPRLGALDGLGLVQFLATLCVVPVLVIGLWLLIEQNGRAQARRFGETTRSVHADAAQLDRTVAALSRQIDANRTKLAEQVTALLAMGDAANTRLSGIANDVGVEISQIEDHARSLAQAGATAQTSVTALLSALPLAQQGVDDAADRLDRTLTTTAEQAAHLEAKLLTLSDRGRDADEIARSSAQALTDRATDLEARSAAAAKQLEAVSANLSRTVDDLIARTAATVEGAREGLAAQGEAMVATISAHQRQLERVSREGAEALIERMETIDALAERLSGRLDAQVASGDLIVERMRTGISDVEERMNRLGSEGAERAQMLAASISALGGSADAMTEALKAGDAMATRTISTTESLLIALDAATREIDETMPEALERLDTRITASKRIVAETKPELLALVTAAESTHDAIEAIAGVIAEQRRTLDQLSGNLIETLQQGRAKADGLGHTVEEAVERTQRFVDVAAPQLVQALDRIGDAAAATAEEARRTLTAIIPEAAAKLGTAGVEAFRRAAAGSVERQVQALTAATEAAAEASSQAAERVARETQVIADQTAIIEARIEEAREERERQGRDSMARQTANLIEQLNSAAIDVTKMMSPEVADSAWAAYLKGDRGVFTRRAVRLLDAADAQRVTRLYDLEEGFRDAVNRYIHDFEAMLRSVLQQPEGSSLSITLLSSDMGKLYVALAQAIERLR